MTVKTTDSKYLRTFLEPVRKCIEYRPKFGQGSAGKGLSSTEFRILYGNDPFYSWIGLDSDLMYSAHRAAGGMTSIYRQIGIGCERLFREILVDSLGYDDPSLATWSYSSKTQSGKKKRLSLDGRLEISEIQIEEAKKKTISWLISYCRELGEVEIPKRGIVFEVRQGYKSKDSKRQNADIDNATVAWAHGYLPVFAVFSSQIDSDIVLRYRNNRCGVLIGINENDINLSLYSFFREVIGYDLAGFFLRNSGAIIFEIESILQTLLSTK